MTDLTFGIQLKSSGGQQVAGDINTSAEAINRLNTSAGKLNETQGRVADETGRGRDALGRFTKSTSETTAEVERLNSANNSLSTSFGSLSSIVKTVAASYVVLKVAQYAQEAALLSARYETLGVSMRVVGNNAGYTGDEMEAAAVGMQKTGISMVESRQQALRLVQAHIGLADSSKLARIAQDAAVIGNMNSSQAFATMIHGIQTGQTDVLRTIGLNISMEQSYAAYASTLGKSTNALTQAEKTQAVLNAVMQEGAAIAGTYEAAMGTAGKQLNSMKRYTEDLQLKFGEVFNEVLTVGVMAFTVGLKDANGQISELSQKGQLQQWGRDVTDMFAFLADSGMSATVPFRLIGKEIGALAAIAGVAASGVGLITKEGQAQVRAIMDGLHAEQQGILGNTHMFRDALYERRQAVEVDNQAKAESTRAFVEYEKQVILTGAATTAREKNTILMAAARAMGAEYANKFPAQAEAINKDAEAYAKIKKHADDYIKTLERETRQTGLDVVGKKEVEAYLVSLTLKTQDERDAVMNAAAAWANKTLAVERQNEADKAATKAAEASIKAEQEYMSGIGKTTESLIEKANAAELENAKIGMTAQQLAQLTGQRYDEQLAVLSSRAAALDGVAGREAELYLIEQQIEALGRLKSAETQRPFLENQKKANDDVGRGLTDALMRGFEKGYGYAQNLAETVKNMFGTMVLRPIISAVMAPVSGAITAGMGAMGIPGMANAAGTASGGDGAGGLGWLTNFGASAGGTVAAAGRRLFDAGAEASGSWLMENSATIGNMADVAGSAMGYYAAFNAAKDGQWATAIGTAVGTYFGGPIGAFIGKTIGGWIDGPIKTPTASTGFTGTTFDATGGISSTGGDRFGPSSANSTGVVNSLEADYLKYAGALGIGAVATNFNFGGNTGKDGKAPNFALGGGAGASQFYQEETPLTQDAVSLAASRAVFAALQGSDLPQYLKGVFSGLDASKMSGQDISNTLAFAASLKQVRTGLTETITPISNAQKQLDGLGTTAATFTTDFVAAIDAGMTPEKLASWQAAGQALGQLGDMSINMTAAIPQLTQTTWEMWNTQTNSVRGWIQTFDGSVAATYALSAATKERYATEQQLVNQIAGAMTNLHTMFSSSNESMRLSVMTSQQKSNYFVDQANMWEAKLLTENDPAKIEEYARKYNDAQSNAWNNMDDTQRQAMLPSYLANNDSIDAYIQNKLGTTLDAITNTSGTELPASYQDRNQDLANRIAEALRLAPLMDTMEGMITNMSGKKGDAPQTPEQIAAEVAAKQSTEVNKESADKQSAAATSNTESASTIKAAADTLVAAAASLLAAANTPTKVDVVFNANVPGDSQLSVV